MSDIKLMMLDIDGVMTDGTIYLSDSGEETKGFNVKDGLGIRLAQKAGIVVAFITGRYSNALTRRAEELKVEEVFQNVSDKIEIYKELKAKYNVTDAEICYIGDDLPDLEPIKAAGVGCAVADAVDEIREAADYITEMRGGCGAVREVVTMILNGELKA